MEIKDVVRAGRYQGERFEVTEHDAYGVYVNIKRFDGEVISSMIPDTNLLKLSKAWTHTTYYCGCGGMIFSKNIKGGGRQGKCINCERSITYEF